MVSWARTPVVAAALVAMIGLAGVALGRIYAGPLLIQLVVGAAVGSVAVGLATRRLPSWLVAPLSVTAMAGYTLLAVRITAQRAELPGALGEIVAEAARNGIPRLLTAMIPVEPVPDTVIVPLVAAWLTGLAGTEVALRADRPLLGFLPPTLLYAGALYVVGPNATAARWPTLAFVVAAVVGLAATGRPAPTTGRPAADGGTGDPALSPGVRVALRARAIVGTALGMSAVIALAAVLAPLVAAQVGNAPVDPRQYVQPPQVDSLDESPLIRISGWALNPDQHLFDLTTAATGPVAAPDPDTGPDTAGPDTGAAEPDPPSGQEPDSADEPDGTGTGGVRVRLAVLSDYDGVTWRVGATYRNAGRVLPPTATTPGAKVDAIRQEITVADLTGRLLPAVPTPRQVDGARVAYDPDTGTLIRPEGLTPGLRYTVTSNRERPDPNLLGTADVPAGPDVARVLRVGDGTPEQLRRLAEQLAAENGAPYQRALAIEEFLSTHYRMVADAPSGHAYPNLAFFLFGPRNAGGQRGTSEQFAASFAVLGRLTGLPTRVVVGFHSPTGTGPVRGANAFAWPEVYFTDVGWVAFDPLPRPDTQPRPVEEDFRPKPDDTPPPPSEEPTPDPTPSGTPTPAAAARGSDGSGLTGPVLGGGGGGLVLLLFAAFAVVVTTLRRRQRRQRLAEGPPVDRIAGAWREVTDALRLAGRPAPAYLTATEVVAHAGAPAAATAPAGPDQSTDPALAELVVLANRAAFAGDHSTPDEARQAAALAVGYASTLRAGLPWWRRALWSLHPGPLRWRR